MLCTKCGLQNPNGAFACSNCGEHLPRLFRQHPGATAHVRPAPAAGQPVPHVDNHLVSAILMTTFCCMPAGIVAIVYAYQANSKLLHRDFDGAIAASKKANIWVYVSFFVGFSWVMLFIIGQFFIG